MNIETASFSFNLKVLEPTIDELGRIGIGKGKARFELRDVSCGGKIIYDSTNKTLRPFETSVLNLEFSILNLKSSDSGLLTLDFLTPTRIIYNSHLTLDKEIIENSKQVIVKQRNLKWYDWERYSFRQDTRMKMGGFIGEITFEGNVEPFMSLIKAGEILHVGKGTCFGLGKYEIM